MSATFSPLAYADVRMDRAPAAQASQTRLMRLCKLQLIVTILVSRLGIPLGDKQIQAAWIVGVAFFLVIGFQTGFAVSKHRFAALAGILVIIAFESAYFQYSFSPLSLVFLFGIYGPLCLTLPSMNRESLREIWKTFVQLTLVLAICGLFQVAFEIVGSYFVDPLSLLPTQFQLEGYMTLYRTTIGPLTYIKPNGMFTLEPSFFSQFVALGLVGELQYFRRPKAIVVLLAALLISFSGTGLLILVAAVPFINQAPKWIVLMFAVGLTWNLVIGDKAGNFYSQRIKEINKPGQSGNARFVAPYQETWDRWNTSTKELFVGTGAGGSSNLGPLFEANFAPVAKVGFEFGLLGLIAFTCYWIGMYLGLGLPGCIVAALWTFYFVASGALLHPPTVFPIWTLTLGFVSTQQAARERGRTS